MDSPTDIESAFDSAFASLGFHRVTDFVGRSPAFNNADYIRQVDQLIVELKVLDKDVFDQGGVIDRFCSIVPSPVNVEANGTGLYTIAWPKPNREGRCDTFEEPLRRILKKANRQIKETNTALFASKGTGFVVLIMNGFRSLAPTVVASMVSKLLFAEFSSISGYIVCTRSPEVWCLSSMSPNLMKHEYDSWYSIAEQIGAFLETK